MPEEKVGEVFQFFQKSSVAAVRMTGGTLNVGDKIHILGNTSDFTQTVETIQADRKPLLEASEGEEVGIKVTDRARPNDVVYKVTGL
jgi:U32 family peptidase